MPRALCNKLYMHTDTGFEDNSVTGQAGAKKTLCRTGRSKDNSLQDMPEQRQRSTGQTGAKTTLYRTDRSKDNSIQDRPER